MSITVYKDMGKRGTRKTFSGSIANLHNEGFKDSVSSIVVNNEGEAWFMYEDIDFKGKGWGPFTFSGVNVSYEAMAFFPNDKISSLKLVSISKNTGDMIAKAEAQAKQQGDITSPSDISTGKAPSPVPDQSKLEQAAEAYVDVVTGAGDLAKDAAESAAAVVDQAKEIVEEKKEELKRELFGLLPGGWWKALTPGQRTGLIIGGLLLVGVGGYLVWRWWNTNREPMRQMGMMLMDRQMQAQMAPYEVLKIAAANPGLGQAVGQAGSAAALGAML